MLLLVHRRLVVVAAGRGSLVVHWILLWDVLCVGVVGFLIQVLRVVWDAMMAATGEVLLLHDEDRGGALGDGSGLCDREKEGAAV